MRDGITKNPYIQTLHIYNISKLSWTKHNKIIYVSFILNIIAELLISASI